MDGGGCSKLYITEKNIEIHCQPITYSTKLADVRDILKYLQGEIYENIDPNNDITLFNIFFRGLNNSAFDKKIIKKPGEIINGKDNNYDLYIFEICSTREIIFKNDKYGKEYINKNLIWNIDVGSHNKIIFDESDFNIIDNIYNIEKNIEEINILCNNKKILIIGPYLLKNDTAYKISWGDEIYNFNKLDYVNKFRKKVKDNLLLCIKNYDNIDYFDMSDLIQNKDILADQYHFNQEGQKYLSDFILHYIDKNIN